MLRSPFALAVLLCIAALPALAEEPDPDAEPSLPEGAWRLVEFKSGKVQNFSRMPPGYEHTKLLTGGRFVWTTIKDGKVIRAAGGTYSVEGATFTETIDFVLDDKDKHLMGKKHKFTWRIEENTWHHEGTLQSPQGQIKITERWERIVSKEK